MSYHCLLRLRVDPLLLSTPRGRHRVLPLSGWAWGFLWHLPLACEACAGLGKSPSPTLWLLRSGALDRSAQAFFRGLGVAGQYASTGEGFLDPPKCVFSCVCPHKWWPLSGLLMLALLGPFYAGRLENHTLAFWLFYKWASAIGPFYLPSSLWWYLPSWLVLPIPILLSLTARLEQFGKRAGNVPLGSQIAPRPLPGITSAGYRQTRDREAYQGKS